jgi:hypothetical protein
MDWVKRNLTFVIGSAVALGLLIFSGWYLMSNSAKNDQVREELEAEYNELKRLHGLDPHPGKGDVNNIARAREQTRELDKFMAQVAGRFAPIPAIPPNQEVTGEQFSAALRRTLDTLTRRADNSSVKLPAKYSFSFEAQKPLVRFDPGSLNRVAVQLGEVKAIADILIAARVNSLLGIRRERVSPDDMRGPQTDYHSTASVTNDLAVISTYEVSFESFSTELAQVVSGFANSPYAMVVKAINVEPASAVARMTLDPYGGVYGEQSFYTPETPIYAQPTPTYAPPVNRYAQPGLGRTPYGGEGDFGGPPGGGGTAIRYPTFNRPQFGTPGGEYGGGAQPEVYVQPANPYGTTPYGTSPYGTTPYGYPGTARPATAGGLVTLIDEEPLNILMVVKVIKLLPAEPEN